MSGIHNHVLRGWEERVISKEKGSRIVHYTLRDSTGSYLLAVVGVESGINRIIYSPTWDYLHAFGSTSRVHGGTRWKSRKNVIKFLISVTSGGGFIFANSNQKRMETTQHPKHLLFLMTRFSQRSSPVDEEIQLVAKNSEILWVGDAWICSKQLKHYPAFCRNETNIPVHSVVWILGGGGKDYLGYVEDMYETLQEEKMVRVRRFLFPEDIKHLMPELCYEYREVFITSTEEQLSARDIDGLASVLAPSHFKMCDDVLPLSLSFKNYICHREFKNSRTVSKFNIIELRGYSVQPVLSSLKDFIPGPTDGRENSGEKGDDYGPQNEATKTCKRIKIIGVDQTVSGGDAGLNDLVKDNRAAKCRPAHQCLEIELANKGPVKNKPMPEAQNQLWPNVNENIELLCQDSGMRGCWLRCKILRSSTKLLKVQYHDVADVAGPGKLEEWVLAGREAAADRLGARCAGRLTVRPWPSWDSSGVRFEVGSAVDAWWCHGWWEGVVIGFGTSALQVYFPGENKFMSVERRNVRASKEWMEQKWVDIMAKRDILAVLTSWLNPMQKVSLPPTPTANSRARAREKAVEEVSVDKLLRLKDAQKHL